EEVAPRPALAEERRQAANDPLRGIELRGERAERLERACSRLRDRLEEQRRRRLVDPIERLLRERGGVRERRGERREPVDRHAPSPRRERGGPPRERPPRGRGALPRARAGRAGRR